ncbi:Cysteine-rich protein 2-binding protein [Apophysomyces ossiformis]|uniref:Cysteine-rich protein 2-binding protein n=1 Tax=Apophysomyces ossiformis TaxID=679940 RepID=A0A8H7ENG0_9FUNG|nr:Cysteine-rich protein 2-binding protein [Apophysomyces ossiformis]
MSWVTIVHLVIYNLMQRQNFESSKIKDRDHKYFRWKEDVCSLIDDYWDYLAPDKQKSITWHNTVASVLSTHSTIFQSGLEKFHQSAWWTLHSEEPPVKDTKTKTTAVKPNLKRPLKRSRNESTLDNSSDKEKRQRITRARTKETPTRHIKTAQASDETKSHETSYPSTEIDKDHDEDLLELSSLSDLSSESELFSADESEEVHASEKEALMKATRSEITDNEELKEDTTKELPGLSAESVAAESVKHSKDPENGLVRDNLFEESNIPVEHTQTTEKSVTPGEPLPELDDSTNELKKHIIGEKSAEKRDGGAAHVQKASVLPSILSQHLEWTLLQKLENSTRKMPTVAMRFKRKLAVRRLKRNLGIKLFDLDNQVGLLLRTTQDMEAMSKSSTIKPAANQQEDTADQHMPTIPLAVDPVTFTPYKSSFASRLYGRPWRSNTMTRSEPWLSTWNGRKLRPYIRRDFENKPVRMRLLQQIRERRQSEETNEPLEEESIDYVYFQREHLTQVNDLLCRCFWDGIDVSESLMYPEFSVLALYKRQVIGCAFMTPEAYITYFAVLAGWEGAGIGQSKVFLWDCLLKDLQTAISKDITLHVSANNNAMILYQKFGFKPEEFIVNFYDKYLPSDSTFSKNAFFLRLRR